MKRGCVLLCDFHFSFKSIRIYCPCSSKMWSTWKHHGASERRRSVEMSQNKNNTLEDEGDGRWNGHAPGRSTRTTKIENSTIKEKTRNTSNYKKIRHTKKILTKASTQLKKWLIPKYGWMRVIRRVHHHRFRGGGGQASLKLQNSSTMTMYAYVTLCFTG